jgi:hypothetical protein
MYPGGGGLFGLHTSQHSPPSVLVALAVPGLFPNRSAPGLAIYHVGKDGALSPLSTYTDPDKSDTGLRDPCWVASTHDDDYVWTSSFVPRNLTVFKIDPRTE